jgi:UDP-2-acetamido-3-amino-2,3-dideoxy-glucuronate N-acetyltransferase
LGNNPQIHELALCESDSIGERTRIWAFSHILPGAVVGADCNICEQVFIEDKAVIGSRVTIKNGVQIWNGVTIADDVFIGPNVTFTNDKYPVSMNRDFQISPTIICKGVSIGANATILPGLVIGENSVVGAGAVVTKDVAPNTTVIGNPAVPLLS